MTNEIIKVTPETMGDIEITSAALEAFRFAMSIPVNLTEEQEADVIAKRNMRSVAFRDLAEFRKRLEKLLGDIKASTEYVYSLGGPDSLPPEGEDGVKISWSKQSFTYEWAAVGSSSCVVHELVDKGIMQSVDEALAELSVDDIVRASGITKDKLLMMFTDDIVEKPKKRTLSIK